MPWKVMNTYVDRDNKIGFNKVPKRDIKILKKSYPDRKYRLIFKRYTTGAKARVYEIQLWKDN
jgi:hypothetical protein